MHRVSRIMHTTLSSSPTSDALFEISTWRVNATKWTYNFTFPVSQTFILAYSGPWGVNERPCMRQVSNIKHTTLLPAQQVTHLNLKDEYHKMDLQFHFPSVQYLQRCSQRSLRCQWTSLHAPGIKDKSYNPSFQPKKRKHLSYVPTADTLNFSVLQAIIPVSPNHLGINNTHMECQAAISKHTCSHFSPKSEQTPAKSERSLNSFAFVASHAITDTPNSYYSYNASLLSVKYQYQSLHPLNSAQKSKKSLQNVKNHSIALLL